MYIRKLLILFFLVFLPVFSVLFISAEKSKKSPFLITNTKKKKRRLSKNRMKENIGEGLKLALNKTAAIIDKMGRMQQRLAMLQKRLVSRVEKLIDNDRSFRKAGRGDLSGALSTMNEINVKLSLHERHISEIVTSMDKNNCLKPGRSA